MSKLFVCITPLNPLHFSKVCDKITINKPTIKLRKLSIKNLLKWPKLVINGSKYMPCCLT